MLTRKLTVTPHSSWRLRSRGTRLLLLCLLLPLLALGTGSCSLSAPPTSTIWSADVQALTPGGVEGTLGVLSHFGETQASMAMTAGAPDTTYAWRMAQGGCDSEGEIVGGRAIYPALATDSTGNADADATLPGELTSGGSYAARILQEDSAGTDRVLACGVMQQTR